MKFKVWDSKENKFVGKGLKDFVLNHEGKLFIIEFGCSEVDKRYIPIYSTEETDNAKKILNQVKMINLIQSDCP